MILNVPQEDRKMIRNISDNFKRIKSEEEIFYDLCFVLCSPQTKFDNNYKVNLELQKRDFYNKDILEEDLKQILKPVRYYNNKARYLLEIKNNFKVIIQNLACVALCSEKYPDDSFTRSKRMRDFLVSEIKGIGMKTASHFLRNQGHEELAIIDTHIIKFLSRQTGCDVANCSYIDLEIEFRNIAKENHVSPAELDIWLWHTLSNTEWEDFKY